MSSSIPGSDRDADRAGVLIVEGDEVALIERHREERRYWVAPGGGVEVGEAPEAAARREAREELGLDVEIYRKVLELHGLHPAGRVQHYFLARTADRSFGAMTGPERSTSSNIYRPVWFELCDVESLNVLPRQLAEFLSSVAKSGWPNEAVITRAG